MMAMIAGGVSMAQTKWFEGEADYKLFYLYKGVQIQETKSTELYKDGKVLTKMDSSLSLYDSKSNLSIVKSGLSRGVDTIKEDEALIDISISVEPGVEKIGDYNCVKVICVMEVITNDGEATSTQTDWVDTSYVIPYKERPRKRYLMVWLSNRYLKLSRAMS